MSPENILYLSHISYPRMRNLASPKFSVILPPYMTVEQGPSGISPEG